MAMRMILRTVATVHAIAVLGQIILAMSMFAGLNASPGMHKHHAWLVLLLGIATAASAWVAGFVYNQGVLRAIALLCLSIEAAQIMFGLTLGLTWHVTLGMLIWTAAVTVVIGAWAKPLNAAR